MKYPGNSSLSEDVRERILSTFKQTRELAVKGSTQEALLGCDFILRMDPEFEIAQVLQARLRTTQGPVDVDDLDASSPTVAVPQEGVIDLGDLDELDSDLPNLQAWSTSGEPDEGIEADALEAAFQDLLDKRELQRLVQVADQYKEEVATNPAVRALVTTAYTRLEAEPYVLEFLTGARKAMDSGNAEEARTLLEKARSLDSSHPGIEELGRLRNVFDREAPAASPVASVQVAEESNFGTLLIPKLPAQPASAAELFPSPVNPEPTAASPAGAGSQGVDFGPQAVAEDGGGSDDRIAQLLVEGQEAFDSGSYQAAIDSWSRIFLIDIDHQEAARRIDLARQHKAEDERRIEEMFSDAIAAFDTGNLEASRQGFEEVLRLNPSHVAAREYMELVERAEDPEVENLPPDSGMELPPVAADFATDAQSPMPGAVMVPPDDLASPPSVAVPRAGQSGSSSGRSAGRRFVMLGAPVLLVLALAGWYGWQHRADFFPNAHAPETAKVPGGNPILRATQLHKAGKTALALKVLRKVSAVDPAYEEAQALISQWHAQALPAVAENNTEQLALEDAARLKAKKQERLLVAARKAFRQGSHLEAVEQFQRAQRVGPLALPDARQLDEAVRLLAPLKRQLEFFRQGEWEVVLPTLWRLHEDDPNNRDVTRLMVNSYYNLAIRDLQRGDAETAAELLGEACGLAPDDSTLERHRLFAEVYADRPKDLRYWIYTKYLPSR